jgi:hypothetical protein
VTSKKSVLSAIACLAMFALPTGALAGHHYDQDDGPRPYAWHDQGRHRGWFKHHHRRYAVRPIEDEDDEGEQGRFRPPERPPDFLCDGDGDDCEPNHDQGDWGDDDYGPPISYYRAAPPAGSNLVQDRTWAVDRQRAAYHALTLMRARHDTKAVNRISTVIHQLDARIARDNQLLGSGGYPSPPVPYNYRAWNSNYYSAGESPNYANYGYNPGYGYNPNLPASPDLNALTSMVGPLLGLPSH